MKGSKYGEDGVLDEVFCHDDKLILRGQKHDINLDPAWRRLMPRTGDVYRYGRERHPREYNARGKPLWDYLECSDWESLPSNEQREWVGLKDRAVTLAGDVSLFAGPAYMDIRINSLWEDFRKRYRIALEALGLATERKIMSYTPRAKARASLARPRTPEERRIEAVRRMLKKYWGAAEYEHDLILPLDIGLVLIEELRPGLPSRQQFEDGVYPKMGAKGAMKVCVYDMRKKHEMDKVKIEVTLRQDYLERAKMKSPAVWETQPDIQERIEATLRREWSSIFSMAKGARAMLAERVKVPQAGLLEFMADTRNTLAQVMDRLEAQERATEAQARKVAQHDRDIEQLKRAAGLK